MIAKEWRDARWKLLVAAIPVMLLIFLISPYQEFVEVARRIPGEDPVDNALRDLSDLYYLSGFVVLMPLAGFLGVAAISGEVSNGTILQLLPRPLSRIRLLLVKYAVGAATLLVAAVLGKILLTCAAAVRGTRLSSRAAASLGSSVLGACTVAGSVVRLGNRGADFRDIPRRASEHCSLRADLNARLRASEHHLQSVPALDWSAC